MSTDSRLIAPDFVSWRMATEERRRRRFRRSLMFGIPLSLALWVVIIYLAADWVNF